MRWRSISACFSRRAARTGGTSSKSTARRSFRASRRKSPENHRASSQPQRRKAARWRNRSTPRSTKPAATETRATPSPASRLPLAKSHNPGPVSKPPAAKRRQADPTLSTSTPDRSARRACLQRRPGSPCVGVRPQGPPTAIPRASPVPPALQRAHFRGRRSEARIGGNWFNRIGIIAIFLGVTSS